MMAVVEAPPSPKPPFAAPYERQRRYCHFLEDCPTGCDDDAYPKGQGREEFKGLAWLADYVPCNPILFQGCTRVSVSESKHRRSIDPTLFELGKVWGEPDGSPNVTLCARAPDFRRRQQ